MGTYGLECAVHGWLAWSDENVRHGTVADGESLCNFRFSRTTSSAALGDSTDKSAFGTDTSLQCDLGHIVAVNNNLLMSNWLKKQP